jgi:hypothetical protein
MAEQEQVRQQIEPAPQTPTAAPEDAELSDEQLDQAAGGGTLAGVTLPYSGTRSLIDTSTGE